MAHPDDPALAPPPPTHRALTDDDIAAAMAAALAQPSVPLEDPQDGVERAAGRDDGAATLRTAGAVLQAFAAGTLRVDVPAPRAEPTTRPAAEPGQDGSPPDHVDFRPRTAVRTSLGVLLLVALLATVLAGRRAVAEPGQISVGIAGGLALLTVVLAAVRSRTSVARLSLTGSRLELFRAGTRFVFDLDDPDLAVEVEGVPGRRGWKVVFPRRGMRPAMIDASMVDPGELMRVLGPRLGSRTGSPAQRGTGPSSRR